MLPVAEYMNELTFLICRCISDNTTSVSDNSGKSSDKIPKSSDKPIAVSNKSEQTSDKILAYIRDLESVSTAEVAMELSLSLSRCRAILASMANQGILLAIGNNNNRRYKIHP